MAGRREGGEGEKERGGKIGFHPHYSISHILNEISSFPPVLSMPHSNKLQSIAHPVSNPTTPFLSLTLSFLVHFAPVTWIILISSKTCHTSCGVITASHDSGLSLISSSQKGRPPLTNPGIVYHNFPISFSSWNLLFSEITIFICLLVYSIFYH